MPRGRRANTGPLTKVEMQRKRNDFLFKLLRDNYGVVLPKRTKKDAIIARILQERRDAEDVYSNEISRERSRSPVNSEANSRRESRQGATVENEESKQENEAKDEDLDREVSHIRLVAFFCL